MRSLVINYKYSKIAGLQRVIRASGLMIGTES